MNPVFTEFANLDTLLDYDTVVEYGSNRLRIQGDITIRECIKSMSEIFPELYNALWQLDVANHVLRLGVNPVRRVKSSRINAEQMLYGKEPDIDVDTDWLYPMKKSYKDIKNNADALKLLKKKEW